MCCYLCCMFILYSLYSAGTTSIDGLWNWWSCYVLLDSLIVWPVLTLGTELETLLYFSVSWLDTLFQVDPIAAGVQYDKEFIVCSLDLLSGLAEALGSGIESLVIFPKFYFLNQMMFCCQISVCLLKCYFPKTVVITNMSFCLLPHKFLWWIPLNSASSDHS